MKLFYGRLFFFFFNLKTSICLMEKAAGEVFQCWSLVAEMSRSRIGSSPFLGVTEAALICDQEEVRQFIATSPLSLELVCLQLFFWAQFCSSVSIRCSLEEKKKKWNYCLRKLGQGRNTEMLSSFFFIWFQTPARSSWLNRWNQFTGCFWNHLLYGKVLLVPEHFRRNLKNRLFKIISLICHIHTHSYENDKQYFMWKSKGGKK